MLYVIQQKELNGKKYRKQNLKKNEFCFELNGVLSPDQYIETGKRIHCLNLGKEFNSGITDLMKSYKGQEWYSDGENLEFCDFEEGIFEIFKLQLLNSNVSRLMDISRWVLESLIFKNIDEKFILEGADRGDFKEFRNNIREYNADYGMNMQKILDYEKEVEKTETYDQLAASYGF